MMAGKPSVPYKAAKLLKDIAHRLSLKEVPSVQRDALLKLRSSVVKDHVLTGRHEIHLALHLCLYVAGIVSLDQSSLEEDKIVTNPITPSEGLAPLALTVGKDLYTRTTSTGEKKYSVISFLETVNMYLHHLPSRKKKPLVSVLRWYIETCISEAQHSITPSLFTAYTPRTRNPVCIETPASLKDPTFIGNSVSLKETDPIKHPVVPNDSISIENSVSLTDPLSVKQPVSFEDLAFLKPQVSLEDPVSLKPQLSLEDPAAIQDLTSMECRASTFDDSLSGNKPSVKKCLNKTHPVSFGEIVGGLFVSDAENDLEVQAEDVCTLLGIVLTHAVNDGHPDMALSVFSFIFQRCFKKATPYHTQLFLCIVRLTIDVTRQALANQTCAPCELLQGLLRSMETVYLFHGHTCVSRTDDTSVVDSCSICSDQYTGCADIASFFLTYHELTHWESIHLERSYCMLIENLTLHVEMSATRHDYESTRCCLHICNRLLPSFHVYVTKKADPHIYCILMDSVVFIGYVLWEVRQLGIYATQECLKFLHNVLSYCVPPPLNTIKKSPCLSTAVSAASCFAVCSTVSLSLLNAVYNNNPLEMHYFPEDFPNKIYVLVEDFYGQPWGDPECHCTALASGDHTPFSRVSSVLRYIVTLCLTKVIHDGVSPFSVLNGLPHFSPSAELLRPMDMVTFVVAVFFNAGLTTKGCIKVPPQLLITPSSSSFAGCNTCYAVHNVLSNLCILKQAALVWWFRYSHDRSVLMSAHVILLLLRIITGCTTDASTEFSLCPKIRCLSLLMLASLGRQRVLVSGVYRAIARVAPPERLEKPLDPKQNRCLMTLCTVLLAFAELHSDGELGLSKISPLLTYRAEDPLFLRLTRLRVLKHMVETQSDDALACLQHIQLAFKDTHDIVKSLALSCITRLCSHQVMHFATVWSIFNGKHYHDLVLTPQSHTPWTSHSLSRFLREYVEHCVAQEVAETMIPQLKDSTLVSPSVVPSFIVSAIHIMNCLCSLLKSQLNVLSHCTNPADIHQCFECIATALPTVGQLGEQFYSFAIHYRQWQSVFSRRDDILQFLQDCGDDVILFSSSAPTAISNTKSFCSISSSLSSPSFLLKFALGLLSRCFTTHYLCTQTQHPLSTVSCTVRLTDAASYCCYFLVKPFLSEISRRHTTTEDDLPPSLSLLIKSLKPFAHSSLTHTLSSSTLSLLHLSTSYYFGTHKKNDNHSPGYHIWNIVTQIIPHLPSLTLCSSLLDLHLSMFWSHFFNRLLKDVDKNEETFKEEAGENNSNIMGISDVLTLSLLNTLHWGWTDTERLEDKCPNTQSLYTDSDSQERYTPSGSPDTFLHTLYAVTALCCRAEVSIDIVDCVLRWIMRLFQLATNFDASMPDEDGRISDVYHLTPQFALSCMGMMTMLYHKRLPCKEFDQACFSNLCGCVSECDNEAWASYLTPTASWSKDSPQQMLVEALKNRGSETTIQLLCEEGFKATLNSLWVRGATCIAERHWDLTETLLGLQVEVVMGLCKRLPQASGDQTTLGNLTTACHGIVEMLHFIDTMNTTHHRLSAVHFHVTGRLYGCFEVLKDVRRLVVAWPLTVACDLLTRRHFPHSSFPVLHDIIEESCVYLQESVCAAVPCIPLVCALDAMQNMCMSGIVVAQTTSDVELVRSGVVKLKRALLAYITHTCASWKTPTTMCSTSVLQQMWDKRLAYVALQGIPVLVPMVGQHKDISTKGSYGCANPVDLKLLLEALYIAEPSSAMQHQQVRTGKTELKLNHTFRSTNNPAIMHQNILILGIVFQHLCVRLPTCQSFLSNVKSEKTPYNNALFLMVQLLGDLSQADVECVGLKARLASLCALWATLHHVNDAPQLNITVYMEATLDLVERCMNRHTSGEASDENICLLRTLQVCVIRAGLRLGYLETRPNIVMLVFSSRLLQDVASRDAVSRWQMTTQDTSFRYVYFRVWNSITLLVFRVPFTHVFALMRLALETLPDVTQDALMWVYAIEQLVLLCGVLHFLPQCSPDQRTTLLRNTACFTALHPRYTSRVPHGRGGVQQNMLNRVLPFLFLEFFPATLFDNEIKEGFPRFRLDVPHYVIVAYAELFIAYCRLHTSVNAPVEAGPHHVTSDSLPVHITRVPLVVVPFLVVQRIRGVLGALDKILYELLYTSTVHLPDLREFALCVLHCSEPHQRVLVKNVVQNCWVNETTQWRAQRILWHLFVEERFPLDIEHMTTRTTELCWTLESLTDSQDNRTGSTTMMHSKDLFAAESGILYLSQLRGLPDSHDVVMLPAKINDAAKEAFRPFLTTVMFPLPACFASTLAEALDRMQLPELYTAVDTECIPERGCLSWQFEAALEYLYVYAPAIPMYFTSQDFTRILTCAQQYYLTQYRRGRYFSLSYPSFYEERRTQCPLLKPDCPAVSMRFALMLGIQFFSKIFRAEQERRALLRDVFLLFHGAYAAKVEARSTLMLPRNAVFHCEEQDPASDESRQKV